MVRRVSFGELSKEQRLRKNTRKMKPTKSSISILPLASSSGDANDQKTDRSVNYRIRIIVLLFLCLQNSGHALVARYSQKTLNERYSTTEVVLVSELIKLVISTFAALYEKNDSEPVNMRKLGYLITHSEKMIVLVFLYSINNILSYVALGKVDAALYTVLSQLKILTTAGFMKFFFERSLSSAKWRALLLLVLGCVLVASPVYHLSDKIKTGQLTQAESSDAYVVNSVIGIIVVLVMVTNSGFASVYLESVLKKEKLSVWDRNFQLSFLSVLLVLGIILSERLNTDTLYTPLFQGFTLNAYLLALIQALGGILVAAALKYADSILKTLATCLAIVVTAVLECVFMNTPMDIFVIIGCVATILAIANYSFDVTPDSS